MIQKERQQPVKEWKAGTVKAALWKSETFVDGRTRVKWSARIKNSYRDKQTGEWKESDYYFPSDLSDVAIVVRHALDYVRLRESEEGTDLPTVAT